MEPRDLPKGRYVTTMLYPKLEVPLPLREPDVETSEVEGEFRVGLGTAYRIPLTRFAVIFGTWRWVTPGDTDDEKLRAVLEARDVDEDVDEISRWGR